jgi:hypothetical protein
VYSSGSSSGPQKYANALLPGPWRPGPPFHRIAVVAHAADAAHDRIEIRHFKRDVVERGVLVEADHHAVVVGVAAQEPEIVGVVGQAEAERLAHEGESRVVVGAVEVDVGHLARPIRPVALVGPVGNTADHREVALLRVLEAETVAAAGPGQGARRAVDRPAGGTDLLVQAINGGAIYCVQHNPIYA